VFRHEIAFGAVAVPFHPVGVPGVGAGAGVGSLAVFRTGGAIGGGGGGSAGVSFSVGAALNVIGGAGVGVLVVFHAEAVGGAGTAGGAFATGGGAATIFGGVFAKLAGANVFAPMPTTVGTPTI
jgi:hypothetical protein